MLAKVLQAGKVKLFLKLENIPMKAKLDLAMREGTNSNQLVIR